MKKRFNLTWRIVTALLLVLALIPALVGGIAAAETTRPTLISISWIDNDTSGTINPADDLIFYFSEGMDTSSLNEMSIVNGRLNSTGGGTTNDYGSTGATFAWTLGDTKLTVTLGTDCVDTLAGKTVNPSDGVKDKSGNIDNTTAPGPAIPISPDAADTYSPQLLSVTWLDLDSSGTYTQNDLLRFQFSESIADRIGAVAVTNLNIDTYLGIQSGRITNAAVAPGAIAWFAGATILEVTLGATAGITIIGGETVTPSLTDWHDNACTASTTAPTIPLTPNGGPPRLVDVVWYDNGNSGTVNQGDWLILRFNESVDDVTAPGMSAANVNAYFTVPGAATFWGAGGVAQAWGKDAAGSMWKIQLGAGTTAQIGDVIQPVPAVCRDKGRLGAGGSGNISTTNKVTADITTNAMETTQPALRSICWWDDPVGATPNGVYDQGDNLFFYWGESINQGTLPAWRADANSRLNSTAEPGAIDYGTGGAATWPFPTVLTGEEWMPILPAILSDMIYRVELLNNEYIFGSETVTPSSAIQDARGNSVSATAARIPYASDTTKPTLLSIGWVDAVVNDGIINAGDSIIFRFSEALDVTTCVPNYDASLAILGNDAIESWGGAAAGTWLFGEVPLPGPSLVYGSQLTIILGATETIDGGEIVNPSGAVTDAKGNADNTPTPAGVPVPLPPDKIQPTLTSIVWQDVDGNSMINQLDNLIFSFSEAMNPATITNVAGPTFVGTQLESNAAGIGADYGGAATVQVIWNTPVNTQCTVILGAGETITGLNEWVNPNSNMPGGVTDSIGNPDATAGSGVQIPSVAGTPPTIVRTPTTLTFTATINGSNPADQTVSISNSGQQTLNWTASNAQTWLAITPASGTNAGTVTATVNISGLAVGSFSDTITITASGATNTPQTVAVALTISTPATPTPTATTNATPTATANVTPTATPTTIPPTTTPTPTATPGTSGSATIPTTGGTVASGDGKVEVTFPSGAFTSSTTVTIASASCHPDTDAFVVGSTCFSVTPGGTLGAAATICVELSSYDLSLGDEGDLTLGYWSDGEWHAVSSEINGNTICGTTNHLSDWAVLSSTGGGWLWWYWALIGGGAFIVVLAIILLLVLPKKGKGEEIPSEELYGEEEEEF